MSTLDVKLLSFVYSVVIFLLSILFLLNMDFSVVSTKFMSIKLIIFHFSIGLDQFNLMFLLLTTFLFPIVIIVS